MPIQGWKNEEIGALGTVITGKTPSTKNDAFWQGDIPFITPPDLRGNRVRQTQRSITADGLAVVNEIPQNAVMVCCIGSIGLTGICNIERAATNQQINSVIVDPSRADAEFCHYAIMHNRPALLTAAQMTTVPILNKSNFSRIRLWLPPLTEQRHIAEVLSAVQRAIERQERLIALSAELKKALMHKLFTEGTRGEPLKETEIGLIPQSWTVTTLGELSKKPDGGIHTGPFGSILHKNEYQNVGTPIVNPTHLIGNRINHANVPRIGQAAAKRLERYRLRDNDLLFGRRGDIGRHGIVTKDEAGWFCGTGCFIVRISDPKIDADYLNAFVSKDEVISWLKSHAAGVIMPNLSNKVLERMPACFPSREEQTVIAVALKGVDDKASAHTRTAHALKYLFRTLLHQLITAQIRVHDLNLSVLKTAGELAGAA
jgi:type I restriction enzyme, S subunit